MTYPRFPSYSTCSGRNAPGPTLIPFLCTTCSCTVLFVNICLTDMSDRASEVIAEGLPLGIPKSFRALADYGDVLRTTLQHRARGRKSLQEKARGQQYLSVSEEKAVVNFLLRQDSFGRPVRIKFIPSIAFAIASQRSVPLRPHNPPGKNWTALFRKRHADVLKASKSRAMDWERYNIYDKVVQWFDVIGKVIHDPAVMPENVWNMDETGVLISKLNSVKVLVSKNNRHGCRGVREKRTLITAIECVSAAGKFLNPMVIWPASTHRANWTTHPTPGWHYAFSDTGYTDSYLSLQWLKLVFDPQTKDIAGRRPRVLLCDGFDTHETLEIMEFCFENNIILCRLPSHSSHELQPCDVSVFAPLKDAYRDQVERLERGCVGKIGKEHFIYLYSPARERVFTPRNIRAGWARAGLFPFNPERVLRNFPKPAAVPTDTAGNQASACFGVPVHRTPLRSPVTPTSAEAVTALHDLIKEDAKLLEDPDRQRLQKHLQKLTNATQLSFAERALLTEHNQFLAKINNEAKPRRATRGKVVGTARVMSYEDIERAKAERAISEARKEAKSEARKAKKAKEDLSTALSYGHTTISKQKIDEQSKRNAEGDTHLQEERAAQQAGTDTALPSTLFRAPVAKMW